MHLGSVAPCCVLELGAQDPGWLNPMLCTDIQMEHTKRGFVHNQHKKIDTLLLGNKQK